MDSRAQQFEQARQALTPEWDAERSARLYAATLARGRRRARRRAGVGALAVVALAAAIGLRTEQKRHRESAFAPHAQHGEPARAVVGEHAAAASDSAPHGEPAPSHTLRLSDGSTATLLGAQSELASVEQTRDRITLELVSGRAHFEVVSNPRRRFTVQAAGYRVQVIGTIFDVEERDDRVDVRVTRGHVRVFGPEGRSDLRAGQAAQFPRPVEEQEQTPTRRARDSGVGKPAHVSSRGARAAISPRQQGARSQAAASPRTIPPVASRSPARNPEALAQNAEAPVQNAELRDPSEAVANSAAQGEARQLQSGAQQSRQIVEGVAPAPSEAWRSLTRSGQYDAAFESLRREAPVVEDPMALMDAADAARLSGHPGSAAQFLQKVARDHRESPVAPLAAFTLGRVYLEELGQPDLAAAAFARCRALDPSGSMAQDALAREVEALSKAGQAEAAYRRAEEYVQRYPRGRRLHAVQLYGGLK